MRLDFPDYTKLVLAELDRKRRSGELPPSLSQPTRVGIRHECAIVYKERFDRRDELTLRNFFGYAESGKHLLALIQGFPIDKFRPLVNYLKGGTENTDPKNLELLAWLIDFRHRPYGFGKEVLLNEEESRVLEGKDAMSKKAVPDIVEELSAADEGGSVDRRKDDEIVEQEKFPASHGVEEESKSDSAARPFAKDNVDLKETAESLAITNPVHLSDTAESHVGKETVQLSDSLGNERDQTSRRSHMRGLIIACLITAICTSGIVAHWMSMDSGCMYWANDHYQKIACDADTPGVIKLPLDKSKMKNFRRIVNEETITEDMIGKIYYIRINGKIEYYTSFGHHPIDNTRTAKVLTKHMFDAHLRK